MSPPPLPPTFSAIREWELAGLSLSSALDKYLNLSNHLGSKSMRENAHPQQITTRIDSTLQSLHPIISQKFTLAHSALTQTRTQLASPFYRLPREILTEIFMRVVSVFTPIDQDTSEAVSMETTLLAMFRNLYSLQSVCRLWRDAILSRGVFWHFAPTYCADIPALRCTQATDLTLERMDGDIYLTAVVKSHTSGLLRTLKVSSRLRKAIITPDSRSTISDLIDRLTEPKPPYILSELSLHEEVNNLKEDDYSDQDEGQNGEQNGEQEGEDAESEDEDEDEDETSEQGAFQILSKTSASWDSFCKLLRWVSILRLCGTHFPWNHMAVSHRLVELELKNIKMGTDRGDFVNFLTKVSFAPNLRNLRIISVETSFDSRSLSRVRPELKLFLPSLESLLIADLPCNTLHTVMDYITADSHHRTLYLTERCTRLVDHPHNTTSFEAIWGHFEAVQAPVHTLVLSGEQAEWLSTPELHSLLGSLISLKTLKLSDWTLGEGESRAIIGPRIEVSETEDDEFPALEQLELSRIRIQDEEWLKKIVTRHPIKRMVIGGYIDRGTDGQSDFSPLRGDEPILDWLRLNVPDFTFTNETAQPSEYFCLM
ncbi:unnamed protein product [Rhizoctonia solani]|uniref:F-box domain-containing protein n=1 Tax=Rhizoctonia solani TaxID=456999 RepID=A0A8H3E469_9AGAM|nr:unnamed protein product [Rhizoctonia solani]